MSRPRVLVGITGGIAAYKTLEVVRLLVKSGLEVRTILTSNGANFVTPLGLETLSGNPVAMDMFGPRRAAALEHIELSMWPDVMVIAPATANFLGKWANGIADDLLSTTMLALERTTPVVLASAMNTRMWNHPAVQRNLARLRSDHSPALHEVGPQEKLLACGETGMGAMAEPGDVFGLIVSLVESPGVPVG